MKRLILQLDCMQNLLLLYSNNSNEDGGTVDLYFQTSEDKYYTDNPKCR